MSQGESSTSASVPSWKRQRTNLRASTASDSDSDEGEFQEYVPLTARKASALSAATSRIRGIDSTPSGGSEEPESKVDSTSEVGGDKSNEPDATSDVYLPAVPKGLSAVTASGRKKSLLELQIEARRARARAAAGEGAGGGTLEAEALLEDDEATAAKLKAEREAAEIAAMEAHVSSTRELLPASELAKGKMRSREAVRSSWSPPAWAVKGGEVEGQRIRALHHIIVEGEDIAPPLTTFPAMKLPRGVLKKLESKGISAPTPIQIQGIPVALSGRDMIGIAFTGSGKTIVFALPAVCRALEEEERLPLVGSEGPIALILTPSRELARQIHENVTEFTEAILEDGGPELRVLLAMGGTKMSDSAHLLRAGIHIVVATPGRLLDLLKRKVISLDLCQYLAFDEADRMIDDGFEEDMRTLFSYFSAARQVVMFSATMPPKIKTFAHKSLTAPIVVNVGRAGAANLDVVQQVEVVQPDEKMGRLLDALQKTPPPVLVFSENKNDVDDILEYLLIKGVDAVSIHGAKAQEERDASMASFKARKSDVLIATDVASKGLDFPGIEHVINYDMPKEIENYVHRIGRTGRLGRTGVATTFIGRSTPDEVLLDLKHLLIEAKQRVPPVLFTIPDPEAEASGATLLDGRIEPCSYCGALGHKITTCPKRAKAQSQAGFTKRDTIGGGAMGGEY